MLSAFSLLGLIVGLIVERKKLMKPAFVRLLSHLLVQMIYPSLIFSSLLLRFESSELKSLWILPAVVFGLLGLGLIFGLLTRQRAGLESEKSRRSYVFLTIMPNYSFVPLVVAQTLFGDVAVGYIAVASVGADLFLWTLAFPQIAGRFSFRKIFSPALLSVLAALLVQVFYPQRGEGIQDVLGGLYAFGKITLPLSMFILGLQLARAPLRIPAKEFLAHKFVLVWRLLVCPAFLFALLMLLDIPPLAKTVLLLAGSMPGAIVTVVLSELYEADSAFAATSIFWGHLLAIVTVSGWEILAAFVF